MFAVLFNKLSTNIKEWMIKVASRVKSFWVGWKSLTVLFTRPPAPLVCSFCWIFHIFTWTCRNWEFWHHRKWSLNRQYQCKSKKNYRAQTPQNLAKFQENKHIPWIPAVPGRMEKMSIGCEWESILWRVFLPAVPYPVSRWIVWLALIQVASCDKNCLLHIAWLLKFLKCWVKKQL